MTDKKGTIVAIGGAAKAGLISELVSLSDKKKPNVVIISAASSLDAEEITEQYSNLFNMKSLGTFDVLPANTPEGASDKALQLKVQAADIIFLSGGDQGVLVERLENTPLLKNIIERYNTGAILAGTSAGAAALSKTMINGGHPKDAHIKGRIYMDKGLDIVEGIIFDTHFMQRGRLPRAFYLAAANPNQTIAGLGENTALVIKQAGSGYVIGENEVCFVKGSSAQNTAFKAAPKGGTLNFENMTCQTLKKGSCYSWSTP